MLGKGRGGLVEVSNKRVDGQNSDSGRLTRREGQKRQRIVAYNEESVFPTRITTSEEAPVKLVW